MSVDMNLILFAGRLTDNPAPLGNSGTGCKFDVASNRTYKNKEGERIEDTTFMPVTCWGPLAVLVMDRCEKGSTVIVEGRIEVRKFESDDGTPRKYVNIIARDVRFVNTRPKDASDTPAPTPTPKTEESIQGLDPQKLALLSQLLKGTSG